MRKLGIKTKVNYSNNTLVVESEDVVKDVVALVLRNKVEDLGVFLGVLLFVNEQLAGDHHNDVTSSRGSGLGIESYDAVANLLKRQRDELLNDSRGALDLTVLKGQHRRITVKVPKVRSVGVELLIVESSELLGNGKEIDRHCDYRVRH